MNSKLYILFWQSKIEDKKKFNIVSMVLSERGESQNPTGGSQQLAGWDGSAQRAHAGACPMRRRRRQSSHPRGHERPGRTRAESAQRTASRGSRQRNRAGQRGPSGTHTSGRYEAAARLASLVLEPWRLRRNIPKHLFVLLPAPVVLSALGGTAAVECTEVSLCAIGHS